MFAPVWSVKEGEVVSPIERRARKPNPHKDQLKRVRPVLVGFSVANPFGRCGFQPHRARPYVNERHESSSAGDLSMNELIFPRQVYMEINSLSH